MTKLIEKMRFVILEQAEFFHVRAAWHVQCHVHSDDTVVMPGGTVGAGLAHTVLGPPPTPTTAHLA